MNKKAAVIGSGFGGLSIAIRLQAQGLDVSIYEKTAGVGGKASQITGKGYTFDMGPSLITAPDIVESLFNAAGKKTSDYLDLIPLDPFYRIYYHDGQYLDYTGDSEKMMAEIAKFSPEDAKAYPKFMADAKDIYQAVIVDGLGSTPFMDIKTMINFLPKALRMKALLPAYQFVRSYFKHPFIRFAFSFHPLFIGGNPFRSPAVYLMIPYLEKSGGVWYTQGGMFSVIKALEKLFLDLGGKIHTDSEVTNIEMTNGLCSGVETIHGRYDADVVVSNADFYHTYKDLVAENERKHWRNQRLNNLKYSMSAFLLYIGSKKQYPELKHHTLILSQRYRELVKDIFDRNIIPDDQSMYLHVPTRSDATMAPEGAESMYILVPVSNLKSGTNWEEEKDKYADKMIDFLEHDFGMENLRDNIEFQHIITPEDFKSFHNAHLGSAWGVEPRFTQTAYFRPHNRSEDIPNLYLTGASTHPGAGVPGVLLTAETTEKVIMNDLKKHTTQSA
jgi:phytoene desaturase